MRTIRTMVIAACGVAASLGGPAAQGWTPSRGGFACSGLIGEVCASDGHAPMCLALAWRAGRLDLVSAAGGGGPMEGATTIRFGGRSTRTTFVFDGRAADAMGVAAARARVPPDLIEAMAAADWVELSTPNAGAMAVHRFSTRGLVGSCGVRPPPALAGANNDRKACRPRDDGAAAACAAMAETVRRVRGCGT